MEVSKITPLQVQLLTLKFRKSSRRGMYPIGNKNSIANISQVSEMGAHSMKPSIPFSKTEANVKFPVKSYIHKQKKKLEALSKSTAKYKANKSSINKQLNKLKMLKDQEFNKMLKSSDGIDQNKQKQRHSTSESMNFDLISPRNLTKEWQKGMKSRGLSNDDSTFVKSTRMSKYLTKTKNNERKSNQTPTSMTLRHLVRKSGQSVSSKSRGKKFLSPAHNKLKYSAKKSQLKFFGRKNQDPDEQEGLRDILSTASVNIKSKSNRSKFKRPNLSQKGSKKNFKTKNKLKKKSIAFDPESGLLSKLQTWDNVDPDFDWTKDRQTNSMYETKTQKNTKRNHIPDKQSPLSGRDKYEITLNINLSALNNKQNLKKNSINLEKDSNNDGNRDKEGFGTKEKDELKGVRSKQTPKRNVEVMKELGEMELLDVSKKEIKD